MIKRDIFHNISTLSLHFPLVIDRPNRQTKLSPTLHFLNIQSLPTSHHHHFQLLRLSSTNSNSKVIGGMNSDYLELERDTVLESDDSDVPVELCYTRTLPPALTLEHGLIKIKEEVEKLKFDPPCSRSGILRFQVAVPPNTKALCWLYSQSKSLETFPQFYLSKMNPDNPALESHSFNGVHGLLGIGAAAYFMGSSCALREWSSIKRYLSADSPLIRAYGFVGINFDIESSSMKHENDSFFFFIPQIELDEYESTSLLAATLAWDDFVLGTFDNAICSFELFLYRAIHHFSFSKEASHNRCIDSNLQKFDSMEDKNLQMVYINADSFVEEDTGASHLELEKASISYQFCFKLSPTLAITRNVLDNPSEVSCSVQHSANINALWASLVIEECSRLGLTYFCIAPGSRSSPLAVAASTHPYTTCISCFDERSLAFHAVGYARGSYKPAVVITSSGTAVSNLFPAVVEASQDFVPLLLLTADRPPELQDAGANQAINQVNHFGSFVRFFFSLPPPTDLVPARMVLTTVDSAVYWATRTPYGPVHVNCPFREPLEDTPKEWMRSCLKGLDFWISRVEPFTKYIGMHYSNARNDIHGQISEVLKLIQYANKGLLLIGAIHTEEDIWATVLLVKHLSWPTVADILSGLRLRKVLTMFPEIEEKFLFVDHLDHALLSDSVRGWAQAEVIIQIGSRITSKRISQMLEACSPCPYIMVDKHPYRHDPSHLVTHRIQSTITEFVDSLLNVKIPRTSSKWSGFLQALNMMVAWEIAFQIQCEKSLTEPHVAQVISEALPNDAALFIGNSMVIRDADMYGCGWVKPTASVSSIKLSLELQYLGTRVAGNRGASGIDGLLSTAIGFAVGCNKRVFCLIGDISFLHDTNGLAILNQRTWRKPMTILVINNHGGAIFSLLPIADKTEQSVLNRYFYTCHNTSISKLCEAHSVYHMPVRTKMELQHALLISQEAQTDCIIEVESCIEDNANFHSTLRTYACQSANNALSILSRLSVPDDTSSDFFLCKIDRMEYSIYRIQLSAPPTSTSINDDPSRFHREGFLLALYLDDGNAGFGEVAPLEIHKENLRDVEEQLRFLLHVIQGVKMSYLLPLLRGSFSSWIKRSLGIPPHSIFPSVRCGLEMAILNAIAARQGSSLSNLLHHECTTFGTQLLNAKEVAKGLSKVQICALVDSNGTPKEVAHIVSKLVKEGFTTIKLKVGRRANPFEDAAVIQEIREKVGNQVKLRADANRKWTYKEACQFGSCVTFCDLQYIEEPVHLEDDIIRFCEETGLPVALDETVDNIQGDTLGRLTKFIHPGIVAVVIKPSVVGGFENAALIAKWAQQQDKMAVVSAAFESSLSLSTYIQFSHYLEQQNIEICKVKNKDLCLPVAHGLGTYRWLREDVTTETLNIRGRPYNDVVEASVEDSARLLQNFRVNPKAIQRSYTGEQIHKYQLTMDCEDFSWSLEVREAGTKIDNNVLIFLHDFLGTGEEWIPIMKAISTSARCISINLPGHGESQIQNHAQKEAKREPRMSFEVIANVLCKLIHNITPGRVVIVGHSMGARIALYMVLRCSNQIDGAVVISGSPGLKDVRVKRSHVVQDDARGRYLTICGLQFFLDTWYSREPWASLRTHPHFDQIISSRAQHSNVHALAKTLSDLSIGRQPSLWEDLNKCKKPMLFIVGEKDRKSKEIAQQMLYEIDRDNLSKEIHEMVEVPDSGNAVHLENPLAVIHAVKQFLTKMNKRRSTSSN